ncbi:hypothetical protein glysoja_007518, partial [Glycine soja]
TLQSFSSNDQSVYTTVLRVTKTDQAKGKVLSDCGKTGDFALLLLLLYCYYEHPNQTIELKKKEFTNIVLHEYKTTTNMTQRFAALASIAQNPGKTRDDVLADFYGNFQVVNKWFALQAMSDIPDNVENVRKLLSNPTFDKHNLVL